MVFKSHGEAGKATDTQAFQQASLVCAGNGHKYASHTTSLLASHMKWAFTSGLLLSFFSSTASLSFALI